MTRPDILYNRHKETDNLYKKIYERVQLRFRNAILHNDYFFVRDALKTFSGRRILITSDLLMTAVAMGNIEIIRLMLEHGANPNCRNGEPLALAAQDGEYKIVNLLCQYGANVNINNSKVLELAEKGSSHRTLLSLIYFSNSEYCFSKDSTRALARSVSSYKRGGIRDFEPKQILCFNFKSQAEKDWDYLDSLRAQECHSNVRESRMSRVM